MAGGTEHGPRLRALAAQTVEEVWCAASGSTRTAPRDTEAARIAARFEVSVREGLRSRFRGMRHSRGVAEEWGADLERRCSPCDSPLSPDALLELTPAYPGADVSVFEAFEETTT